jgi:RNA polymerase sigma-70 factor (ECF subfamily)
VLVRPTFADAAVRRVARGEGQDRCGAVSAEVQLPDATSVAADRDAVSTAAAVSADADGVEHPSGSFEDFYRAEHPRVVRLAYALTGSWSVAEDIAQEAFLRALPRFDGQLRRPDAWIRPFVANLARSRGRRARSEVGALLRLRGRPEPRSSEVAFPAELEATWRAVRRLPPRQRLAIALFYVEDRSIADIALVLDCAEGTVKATLHQARTRLATLLDEED